MEGEGSVEGAGGVRTIQPYDHTEIVNTRVDIVDLKVVSASPDKQKISDDPPQPLTR